MSNTVAEAITRLQNAKNSIKTSIENKGVSVPSDTKIDKYSEYIDQISSGTSGLELFMPASVTVEDAVYNKNSSVRTYEDLFDTVSPDGKVYYHYFRYNDDASTAYSTYKVGVLTKTAGNNPGFTGGLTSLDERRTTYPNRVVEKRMKKEGGNVIFSLLYTDEYDSNWQDLNGRSITYYCLNITNTSGNVVNLGSIAGDSKAQYDQAKIDEIYKKREESCGMKSGETLQSLGLTSLGFTSNKNYFNLVATINY